MHVLILLLFAFWPATAQSVRGSIAGLVTNASGSGLPGSEVRMIDEQTGRTRSGKTSRTGEFLVTGLPAGSYRVEAAGDGYRKSARTVALLVNQEVYVELPLLEARSTERVEVSGKTALLKTESA